MQGYSSPVELWGFLVFFFLVGFFFFWLYGAASGTLVPQPGTEPAPLALGAWSLYHWPVREVRLLWNFERWYSTRKRGGMFVPRLKW